MKYNVKVFWEKKPEESFTDNKYSRVHKWAFDGGEELMVSSSPQVVPLPMSDESAADPEEAFVAALSSCHMLFFLSIAATQNYIIEKYEDNAEGLMRNNENGKMAMTVINLKPKVTFYGNNIPSFEQITNIHKQAHNKCYLANSVKSQVNIVQE